MYYPKPKKKLAIPKILDVIIKLLTIVAAIVPITPIIGYLIIYNYLSMIDQLSLISETLSSSTSFLVIAFIVLWIALIITIVFLVPPIISFQDKEKSKFVQCKEKSDNANNNSKLDSIIKKSSNFLEKYSNILYAIIYLTFIVVSGFVLVLSIFDFEIKNSNIMHCIILLVFISYFIIISLLSILAYIEKTTKQQQISLIILSIVSSFLFLLSLNIPKGLSNFLNLIILTISRFVETPGNSSWYLLHNNFQSQNSPKETNGINENDLKKMKEIFKCPSIHEEVRKLYTIECEANPEKRNNALYGYMAWNMGDTKVFCPASVINFRIDTKDKTDLKSCIVISGKALQIMPESYISTNTDGIDDGNPENTGHDNPEIDINTDVRFKNDLNAQSNAGLTNYNIQPVLPIQSNAKNMSIQINYGNCNHDSRHPDIGNTDKKICQ